MNRDDQALVAGAARRPDDELGLLLQLRAGVGRGSSSAMIELYRRVSVTVRADRRPIHSGWTVSAGEESGLAVRTWSGPERAEGFAWSTAHGATEIAELFRQAERNAIRTESALAPWSVGAGTPRFDHRAASPPTSVELCDWLEGAWRQVTRAPSVARDEVQPVHAWVEVAVVTETWVADGGLMASRTRIRGRAGFRWMPGPGQDVLPQPVIAAFGGWAPPAYDTLRRVMDDRWSSGAEPVPAPGRPIPVLFGPDASAVLVAAIVRLLVDRGAEGVPVGPAFKISGDPADPLALFGGSFDDAGFPTSGGILADGAIWTGIESPRGWFRRGSFRDRPRALPTDLAVAESPGADIGRAILASDLRIHGLAPDDWVLEIGGALLSGSRPTAPIRRSFIRIDPAELVRRCTATVGPPRRSHLGITTPALLFDRLNPTSP